MNKIPDKMSQLSNEEIFITLKTFILREELGYFVNHKVLKEYFQEAELRNEKIIKYAFNDAIYLVNQIRMSMGNTRIIDIKRIDFLSEDQLKLLLFTIGAAKKHENLTDKETETTSVSDFLGMQLEDILLCKVIGESMEKANIFEGDTLIIDTKSIPKDEDIVVVTINGQTLVKRLKLEDGNLKLMPENDKFKPHIISENDSYSILGKVKHILHTL